MAARRVVVIERQEIAPGLAPVYVVRPGRRFGRWIRWAEADMPEFARAGGAFEIERVSGGRRWRWRVIGPPPPYIEPWRPAGPQA